MENLQSVNRTKLNKILTLTLAIIWSAIGYRYFKPNTNIKDTSIQPLQAEIYIQQTDTTPFVLKPLTRDPFSKTTNGATNTTKNVKAKPKGGRFSNPKTSSSIWPTIEYFGYVQKQNQPAPLALVKINDSLFRIRKGQVKNEVEILDVFKDSIAVRFNNQVRFFAL